MRSSVGAIGKYEILGTLGTGAHSTIFHIYRPADRKAYALKEVLIKERADHKFIDQAEHEYDVAQLLDHVNLIKIYALETVRNWYFRIEKVHLLLEYVDGKTLDAFPRIPLPQLIQIFAQVADGLVHMHRRGICHADLKPNNVMLSRKGQVKIIDLGLAWIRGHGPGRAQGTPEYMAPEQLKDGVINEATDIYNFGATMYRLVTSHLPLNTVDELNLPDGFRTTRKRQRPVQDYSPEAPPRLCELIHRCLSHEPYLRPGRASEIYGALDHLAEDLLAKSRGKLKELEW
jgi:eukaryotic-like serine/threonine-protein kinase